MDSMDRLQWELEHTACVQAAVSAVNFAKRMNSMLNESNFRWYALPREQRTIYSTVNFIPAGFINRDCDLSNIYVYLEDHKAETLNRVTNTIEEYAADNPVDGVEYLLAAGSAGIEAATNQIQQILQLPKFWV